MTDAFHVVKFSVVKYSFDKCGVELFYMTCAGGRTYEVVVVGGGGRTYEQKIKQMIYLFHLVCVSYKSYASQFWKLFCK